MSSDSESDHEEYFNRVPPPEKCDFGDYRIDPDYRKELYKQFPFYTGEEIVGSYLGYNPHFPSQEEWLESTSDDSESTSDDSESD